MSDIDQAPTAATPEGVVDPDALVKQALEGLLRGRVAGDSVGESGSERSRDEALRIFLCGYAGAGNTGADVRVHEILRQCRHLWGDAVAMRLSVIDPSLADFFQGLADCCELTSPPEFLDEMNAWADLSLACEGSLFKSNFADTLSLVMLASLALAQVRGKQAVAYGAEAGSMSAALESFAREFCKGVTVFARNPQSRERLEDCDFRARLGADTAWSFDPGPSTAAEQILRDSGWDGEQPIVAVAPVNAYWWPVRADPVRYQAFMESGAHAASHYGHVYFHAESEEITRHFEIYLDALSEAVQRCRHEWGAHIAVIGMDRVDRGACEGLVARLEDETGGRVSQLICPDHPPQEIVSVLRLASLLVSSRFHAIVCSMPTGVPAVGLAFDERVRNLLQGSGQQDLIIPVEEGVSAAEIEAAMRRAWDDRDNIASAMEGFAAGQLRSQGAMARELCAMVAERHPNLAVQVDSDDPVAYLPPLSATLQALLQNYPDRTTANAGCSETSPSVS